jgi:predicted outer membrane repeat protein
MSHNTAGDFGGGLYCTAIVSTATLTGVTLTDDNRATNVNGTGQGGDFFVGAAATLSLNSCTVAGNNADETGSAGGLVQANANYTTSNCTITDPVKIL